MTRYLACILSSLLVLAGGAATDANAQAAAAQAHVAAAKAASEPRVANPMQSFHSFKALFDQMCAQPRQLPDAMRQDNRGAAQPMKEWYSPPIRLFDNLYFIGTKGTGVYAVNTPQGVVVIDTNFDWDIKELVLGLLSFGVDPENIKYIIVTHGHDDRYFGAKALQETYPNAHVIMSQADWDLVAKDNNPAKNKPKKDMVATDGQKLTLGGTNITMYITPGHTPGTLSLIIEPLTNRKSVHSDNDVHVASLWGGTDINIGRNGVTYYPDGQTMLKTYLASLKRFKDLSDKAGVDTILTTTLAHGNTNEKIKTWRIMNPGHSEGGAAAGTLEIEAKLEKDPHPFVNKDAVNRYYTVLSECYQAQLAWRTTE